MGTPKSQALGAHRWPPGGKDVDTNLEGLRTRFDENPGDTRSFEALEEAHFLAGEWSELIAVYEQRLTAPELAADRDAPARAKLVLRLGQVLEERCQDPDGARQRYEEAAELDPSHRPTLTQLRRIYAQASRWDRYLALAQQEAGLAMRPFERAAFFTEVGEVWLRRLGDPQQAVAHFENALEADADHAAALLGLAAAQEKLHAPDLAAAALERAIERLRGRERSPALVSLGHIYQKALGQPDRALEAYQRALHDDPQDDQALEALAERAADEKRWAEYDAFQESRYEVATDDIRRLAVAHEAGRVQLEERGDAEGARRWFDRAIELFPDDPVVHLYLADVERISGNQQALGEHLRRAATLAADAAPTDLLQESAQHATRDGDDEFAVEQLRRALARDPGDSLVRADLMAGLERLGRDDELIEMLTDEATSAPPGSAEQIAAWLRVGTHHEERLGDTEAARSAYERAFSIDPGSDAAALALGRSLTAAEDWQALRHLHGQIVELPTVTPPRRAASWCELGDLALIRFEEPEAAQEAFQSALELDAASPRGREGLERVALALGDDEALLTAFEREAEVTTDRDRLEFLVWELARIHEEREDPQRALHWLEVLAQASPEDARALEGCARWQDHLGHSDSLCATLKRLDALARLLDARGAAADAAEAWSAALENAAPADLPEDAGRRLEALLATLGRWDELLARLTARREALDPLAPGAFELDMARAEILLEKQGDGAGAIELFDLALEADPDSRRARTGLERALRIAGRSERLVVLLEQRAREEADAEQRAVLALERATLLEETLEQLPEAKSVLAEIADGASGLAGDAERRLTGLLERTRDWATLRERKQAQLGRDDAGDLALQLELAELSLDRLEDRGAAILHLEAAAELAPGRAETWQQLASLYEQEHDAPSRVRALEAELATDPGQERTALLHGSLAELYLGELADEPRAEEHFVALLAIDGSHARASEFLAERYERDERHEELVELLLQRLEELDGDRSRDGARTSLRLRIAALQAGPLAQPTRAIQTLEAALEESEAESALAIVAEPLADLYEREGRGEQMIALARRAVSACEAAEERAPWSLRIADALARTGDRAAAADAYRQALADRPDDRGAQSALRELYRKLGEAEPLVRLLEAELARVGGSPEIPLRMELATLLAAKLERPGDALVHLRRVLQLAPDHAEASDRALELATSMARHEDALELLELTLARTRSPLPRSRLLTRRGDLQVAMSRPADALHSFQEAVALAPGAEGMHARIRELLRSEGDWPGVLGSLESETTRLPAGAVPEREALLEEGATLAEEHLGADHALPWLARLRTLRPDDGEVLRRIAAIHRAQGRIEPLLRALEDELTTDPEDPRRAELQSERARLFESERGAPGRAIAAWEGARHADPGAHEPLVQLERLYRETERERERAGVLDVLLERSEGSERLSWRRSAAEAARQLGDPSTAASHLWQALCDAGEGIDRVELLRELAELWPRLGRRDLWARTAEAELACLDPEAPVFSERRRELHGQLAAAYRLELARPDKAMGHLRAWLDGDASAEPDREAEDALLDLLRRAGETVELEARLTRRLERDDEGQAPAWLELARLRHERLHRLSGAARAYQRVLELDPSHLEALRGLRDCASRLGRTEEVADTLERELALRTDADAPERAALYRSLGEITWRELDSTTRASRAFAAALEADPTDRISLRSLQALFETMEDWRGAADLYESEVSVLGENEPERRQEAWLRIGAIARDRLGEQDRAITAYEAAADLAPLALPQRRAWADLYEQAGRREQHVSVLASWVDAEGSSATVGDHLHLAETLEGLERNEPALARVERALALAPEHRQAWDAAARLNEMLGRDADAALAYERAAGCTQGAEAARRRLAASLHAASDEERVRLLDRATADDPGCAEAHARLAVASARIGQTVQAEQAALRALDLEASLELPDSLILEMALAGGRAARSQEHGPQALGLFEAALRIDPHHPEALAAHGEVALEQGDAAVARASLSHLVEREGSHPDRAIHLTRLGQALQAEGECAQALAHFQDALAMDVRLDDAHRGLTQLLEREGNIDEAVDALQTWAVRTAEPEVRAGRLMPAARLELGRPDREEPAEALLREAVSVQPDHAEAWTLLCDLLWTQGRATEALDQATRALDALGPVAAAAPVALVRGRALEQRGDQRAAADSFRLAMDAEPRCAEGALSAARLLRALGEWREAADALQRFIEVAPEDARDQLAPAHHQLGRLLAGPLEDVDGAIEVYLRALEADPTLDDAQHALADLLVHRPERWGDAVHRHLQLLAADPLRLASLRGLLQIARGRDREEGVAAGLAILRALGCATPEERVEAAARLPGADGGTPMSDPVGEAMRRVACEIAEEIGEALGVGASAEAPPTAPGADAVTRLRAALVAAEGALCAPGLVPLSNQELGSTLTLAAQLSLELDAVQGDGDLVNGLSRVLGRRVRKRVRKALGSVSAAELSDIDWDRWRLELRAEAALRALESVDGELRSAFLAWLEEAEEGSAQKLPPESDLRDRISGNVQARVFLQRLIHHWSECL